MKAMMRQRLSLLRQRTTDSDYWKWHVILSLMLKKVKMKHLLAVYANWAYEFTNWSSSEG